jgi:hypothetical protein
MFSQRMRIVGRTVDAPGLPYVTRCPADPGLIERFRAGLRPRFADRRLAAIRGKLLIGGLDVLAVDDYRCMADMEADAKRRCYVELD